MKTIGLIGGMSWESSLEYYRIINEEVKNRLGRTHSAKSIMISVDFEEIEKLQNAEKWDEMSGIMVDIARKLELAGADCIVICTNTMHKLADAVEKAVNIPLIHIADATARVIKMNNINKIGLLGTKYTMEQDFYKGKLDSHDLKVIIPEDDDRNTVHDVIYNELVLGEIRDDSILKYVIIIDKLKNRGAQGVILGCTEIGLLIKNKDSNLKVFDTTYLHAIAAVDFALE
ncbi:MAG: aspartate racemase [bacterium]|nr:MAG: aspartate racemase [bacterium]